LVDEKQPNDKDSAARTVFIEGAFEDSANKQRTTNNGQLTTDPKE